MRSRASSSQLQVDHARERIITRFRGSTTSVSARVSARVSVNMIGLVLLGGFRHAGFGIWSRTVDVSVQVSN
jgi:hypothetical protein